MRMNRSDMEKISQRQTSNKLSVREKPSSPNLFKHIARLRDYLARQDEPNARLNPKCLAQCLGIDERELLGALAHSVRDGLVELHWEVFCPVCGLSPEELSLAH